MSRFPLYLRPLHHRKFLSLVLKMFKSNRVKYLAASLTLLFTILGGMLIFVSNKPHVTSSTVVHSSTQKNTSDATDQATYAAQRGVPTASSTSTQPTPPAATHTATTPTNTQATPATPKNPAPVVPPSISLASGHYTALIPFTTVNINSSAFLLVLRPVSGRGDIVTPEGLSLAPPPYSGALGQAGSFTFYNINELLMRGDDVYTISVCQNINGTCGVQSGTRQLTVSAQFYDGGGSTFTFTVN